MKSYGEQGGRRGQELHKRLCGGQKNEQGSRLYCGGRKSEQNCRVCDSGQRGDQSSQPYREPHEAREEKLLFYGGRICTMAEGPEPEALLTAGGRIAAVGSREELQVLAPGARGVNLEGRGLLPGFVDSHSHFSQVAAAFLQVPLDGIATVEEVRRAVAEYLKRSGAKPGEWVLARGYDQNRFPGGKNLTLEQLDSLCPQNPLLIQHQSGHMGLVNSLGLRCLGITEKTEAPAGGRIGVRDGRLTGYLEENAFMLYLKRLPPSDPQRLLEACRRAQEKYASFGITAIQDGMAVKEMLPLYRLMLEEKVMKSDLFIYFDPAVLEEARHLLPELWDGRGPLRAGGIKIFLDGSPQGRTAWMREPYAGERDYRGYGILSDQQVLAAMETAAREGLQLLAHCNGDAAAGQYLDCLEEAEKRFPQLKALRPVLIHGQLLGRDQLEKAAALGVIVSFFAAHVYHWGDVHLKNFGPERAAALSPAASALRVGLPFTLHQDSPVIEPDMMETVWCAVNRMTKGGLCLGPEERISVKEALRAVTARAAFQYFEEEERGTLEPGKRADLTILEQDPFAVPKGELKKVRVSETYLRGERIFGGNRG